MLTLYQFPISHYCEKIRWALDYKGLDYNIINLLPGSHIKVVKQLAPKSDVPLLVHDGNIIQNSSDIITYLDNTFPEKSLTPVDPELAKQALEWEAYADEQVGPHVRLYCYYYFLDRPDITVPLLTHGQAWYRKLMFRLIFPKVREVMRKYMNINDRTAAIALKKLEHAIDKLHVSYEQNSFLAGDQFCRADLAAASLLAPFCMPDKYGLDWPDKLPTELEKVIRTFRDKLNWLDRLYQDSR